MRWVTGWQRRVTMVGVFALVGAAIMLPRMSASGGTFETFGSAGILRLHTGAQDYFRFDPSNGSDPTQTNIGATNCKVGLTPVAPSTASLVTLSQTPTTTGSAVGFHTDGLGVKVLNEGSGVPCGQVNSTGQSLTIALAGVLSGKVAYYADLDVEIKFTGTKVRADMSLKGVPQGFLLFDCTSPTADCGPDSADNYRLQITGFEFDAIKLSTPTTGGAFSLKGGSDGGAETTIHISGAEGTLACNQTATETGGPGEPSATVQRINATGCSGLIPYSLDSSSDADSQDVSFVKDISENPNDSFYATIDWAPEPAQYALAPTTVDEGGGQYTPKWCDGTFASPSLPADYTATMHWCVRKETAESAGPPAQYVHRITYYFGFGDPLFSNGLLGLGG